MFVLPSFGLLHASLNRWRGYLASRAGRWREASVCLEKSVAANPRWAASWVRFGHALKETGRSGEAELAYRRAIALRPDVADTWVQLGRLLRRLGRPEAAIEALRKALDLDPTLHDVRKEIVVLERTTKRPDDRRAAPAPTVPAVVFDVADLLSHFEHRRLPTGIQRVQIEVVCSLLSEQGSSLTVGVCAFLPARDAWVQISAASFIALCNLALRGSDVVDPLWTAQLDRLWSEMGSNDDLRFAPGVVLVNLGSSWSLQNYFLRLREAKANAGIYYFVLVHDLIPILHPEFFVPTLVQDFIGWAVGIFSHADLLLCNSDNTACDLRRLGREMGRELPPMDLEVVRLDALPSRKVVAAVPGEQVRDRKEFVLFVSTLEPRKNHAAVFRAWQALIRKHGSRAVPALVCVGGEGWLNRDVLSHLSESRALRAKVEVCSGISDSALDALYRDCLFALYPSRYEGWGLPITEALGHGKAVLASNSSSLPEAGGRFADYFRLDDQDDLVHKLERLIFDLDYRNDRESLIQTEYKPRTWSDIGHQILAVAARRTTGDLEGRHPVAALPPPVMVAEVGLFYLFRRNVSTVICQGCATGEMFRSGGGWRWPEDWGVWTLGRGGELAIGLDGSHSQLRLGIWLRGLQDRACVWRLDMRTPTQSTIGGRLGPSEHHLAEVEFATDGTEKTIVGRLTTHELAQSGPVTAEDVDPGVGVVGLMVLMRDDQDGWEALTKAVACDDPEILASRFASAVRTTVTRQSDAAATSS